MITYLKSKSVYLVTRLRVTKAPAGATGSSPVQAPWFWRRAVRGLEEQINQEPRGG